MIEKIILGSKSPRRQELVKMLGYPCEIRTQDVEENYPKNINASEVPEFLAQLKAQPLLDCLRNGEVLITSDTIVVLDHQILGKPKDEVQAVAYLKKISGKTHQVISGVFMASPTKQISFSHTTAVTFYNLTQTDIESYVSKYKPLDKAGAYGIQEWIGQIGVKSISGSYLNVVGLPLADVKEKLSLFN